MGFQDSLDIANRALQLCGSPQILSVTEDSKQNLEASFSYDKLRKVELRRNTWRFAIRNAILRPVDTTTMTLVPATYDATVTYLPGAIVKDSNGLIWLSETDNNINNAPGGNNEVWHAYFGPMTIQPYDTTGATTYHTGELVYVLGTNPGSYAIFQSLTNSNTDVPNTATAWDALTSFNSGSVVSYLGQQWSSLIELNKGITPAVGPVAWDPTATYTVGQTVTGTDNFIYSSVGTNTGFNPVTDSGAHWTNTTVANAWRVSPIAQASSTNWRVLNATLKTLRFSYPIGSGPSSQTSTLNVYRLPAGYLRVAPQDPKAGSTSPLGGPSGRPYDDWDLQSNFLVSRDTGPLLFRFVADMTKVSDFDDMFCEGLACRVAEAVCVPLTQSDSKLGTIAAAYKQFMGEARIANFIEIGAIEPPEDDFIQCRA